MFQYTSDIHLEYLTRVPYIKKSGDNIFLVGDIGHPGTQLFHQFITYCSSLYKNVFLVYGNHEYYSTLRGKNKKIETMKERLEYVKYFPRNVYFLNNSCVYFNKYTEQVKIKLELNDDINNYIKIIGSTLWSNKDKTANNFKNIYVTNTEMLTYEYQSNLYNESKSYILNELNSQKIDCILLTHYSTHISCIGDYIVHKDANHITELFDNKNLVCCINGHTHTSINMTVPGTSIKLLSNCYGYRGESNTLVKYNENATYTLQNVSRQVSFNGIYGSGINYINLLYNISTRPNPKFELGVIDKNSAFTITDSDKDNSIIYANSAFEKLTEYSFEEIKGKNCRFLQGPDGDIQRGSFRKYCDNILLNNIKQNIINKTECQYITKNFTKSGKVFINIITIIPFAHNGLRYFIGFQKNITEYIINLNFRNIDTTCTIDIYVLFEIFIKDDINLHSLLKYPSSLFNNTEYMIGLKDKETGELKLNNTFLNKFEYTQDDIDIDKISYLDNVHPNDINIRDAAIEKVQKNEYVRTTIRFYTKNNNIIELLWTVLPHHLYCFSIIQDITRKPKTLTHSLNQSLNQSLSHIRL